VVKCRRASCATYQSNPLPPPNPPTMDSKAAMTDGAFDEIEESYQKVLDGMDGDEQLGAFKGEYEKLHAALQKSHEGEKRLMTKCRELNAELVAAAAKVESVATNDNFSSDDSIAEMEKQLEQQRDSIAEYHTRESQLKDQIRDLKDSIDEMSVELEQGAGQQAASQADDVSELIRNKKQMQSEHETLTTEVLTLRKELDTVTAAQHSSEAARETGEAEISNLTEQLTAKRTEYDREMRKKKQLEREKTVLTHELGTMQGQIDEKQVRLQDMQQELDGARSDIGGKKLEIEKLQQDTEQQNEENARLIRAKETADTDVDRAKEDTQMLKRDLKDKESQLASSKKEAATLQKDYDKSQRDLRTAQSSQLDVEQKRQSLKTEVSGMERDLDALKRDVETKKKRLEEESRAREILTKKTMSAGTETEMQKQLVRTQEERIKSLEAEIQGFKKEAQTQRKLIFHLEKERDRHVNDASVLTHQCMQSIEKNKVLDMQIADFKKKIKEAEMRLKTQQQLYEQVRSDRNLYSKNFLEAQDEITEKKRKLKIMRHQIEQLKEEIHTKENQLGKKHSEMEDVRQEQIKLKAHLDKLQMEREKHDKMVKVMLKEKVNLERMLNDVKGELARKVKQFEEVVNERDILGTQLIRRNDELGLVYEKIRIQQSTLGKGETQYRQRLDDIRLLRMEIKRLQREKIILNKTVSNVEQLKREVHHAQRDLLRERMRCRALEEELETPMNVHRWRKLKGSDPSTYEKIQKIQTLQKRLIAKTEEVVGKELDIQEREKEYLELKSLLARQPGPEVQAQIQIYQQTLKDKQRQLKSMASELNMYKSQSSEYQYEIERLARELQETKKRYFDQKRKDFQQREHDRAMYPSEAAMAETPRFTGGGFSLQAPTPRTTDTLQTTA